MPDETTYREAELAAERRRFNKRKLAAMGRVAKGAAR
jgi:hypothetical protein